MVLKIWNHTNSKCFHALQCQLNQTANTVPRFLSEELLIFHGCGLVAIGTQEGHVYLVDFAMDEGDMSSDESNPSQAYFFDLNNFGGAAEKIAQVRADAVSLRQHGNFFVLCTNYTRSHIDTHSMSKVLQ